MSATIRTKNTFRSECILHRVGCPCTAICTLCLKLAICTGNLSLISFGAFDTHSSRFMVATCMIPYSQSLVPNYLSHLTPETFQPLFHFNTDIILRQPKNSYSEARSLQVRQLCPLITQTSMSANCLASPLMTPLFEQ